MTAKETYLEQIICDQRQSVRFYVVFAVGLVLLGILILSLSLVSSRQLVPDALKGILGIGGAFVSSLSAFPIKEIRSRKEKLGMLNLIKFDLSTLEEQGDSADANERIRLYSLIDDTIKAILTGRS